MMNDPMVLEASRVLAERLMLEDLSEQDRIAKAARLILCRRAGEEEMKILTGFFNEEKKYYQEDGEKAKQKLAVGEFKHEETGDVASTAALMQVVSTLYNMDEAITK
jgi:hypothetical protein